MLRYEEKPILTHGIVAINKNGEIIHFCAYTKEPTEGDYTALHEELESDPEFNISEEFVLFPCPPELLEMYLEIIEEAYDAGNVHFGDE